MLGGECALAGASDDVQNALLGLAPDLRSDVGACAVNSVGNGHHVVGETCHRDEVGNDIRREDYVPQSTHDLELDRDRHVSGLEHVVEDNGVEQELATHLLADALYLVHERFVAVVACVGFGTDLFCFCHNGFVLIVFCS